MFDLLLNECMYSYLSYPKICVEIIGDEDLHSNSSR